MAKNEYPSTTLEPLQKLDFKLANGDSVRAILKPRPNYSATKVAYVDVECASAGSMQLTRLGNKGAPRTVMQAGIDAYQFVQHEVKRVGVQVIEVLLEGEEFLEKADVEQIIGNDIPVKLV